MEGTVCVIGLGYVGLPLAVEFAKHMKCIGFEVNETRIDELKNGTDSSKEISDEQIKQTKAEFTSDSAKIKEADYVVIAVPTPINENKEPDLSFVEKASITVGQNLKKGAIVIYESTVWPGITEEFCVPILEKESGMKCGKDFKIAYSPERINPGDEEHSLKKIVKVVSAMDEKSTKKVAELYEQIIDAGVYIAPNIKTAEAAKSIENIQRDLNIALVNELSKIFHKNGLDTESVLNAADTKWNFHKYHPGLVGGHCIPVDPYYMVERARRMGYDSKVILAGRDLNNSMPEFLIELTEEALKEADKEIGKSKIVVLGITFKENVPDERNSGSRVLVELLKAKGAEVIEIDPVLEKGNFNDLENISVFIFAVPHNEFKGIGFAELKEKSNKKPIIIDPRWMFKKEDAEKEGFIYKRL